MLNSNRSKKYVEEKWKEARRKIPTGKELLKMYPPPKELMPQEKALLESTKAVMKALDERIKKYGYPPDFRH